MKKFLALLISLSMLIMCVPGISLVASAADDFTTITTYDNWATTTIDGETYYLIDSADKFRALFDNSGALTSSTPEGNFALAKDIDLTGTGYVATNKKPQRALNFNGQNYTVTVNITTTGQYYGALGGSWYGGSIKNVKVAGTISSTYGSDSSYTGGIVGALNGTVLVENCENLATVTSTKGYTGGIVGGASQESVIKNCTNAGAVTASTVTGGIVGAAYAVTSTHIPNVTVEGCVNNGAITSSQPLGGIVGGYSTTAGTEGSLLIKNCSNNGESSSASFGGILGNSIDVKANMPVTIEGCYNTATLSKGGAILGAVAYHNAKATQTCNVNITIKDCYNTGDVSGYGVDNSSIIGRGQFVYKAEGAKWVGSITVDNYYDVGSPSMPLISEPSDANCTVSYTVTDAYVLNPTKILVTETDGVKGVAGAFLKTVPTGFDSTKWEAPSTGYPYIQLKDNKIGTTSIVEDTATASIARGTSFVASAAIDGVMNASGVVTPIAEGTNYAIVAARVASIEGAYEYGIAISETVSGADLDETTADRIVPAARKDAKNTFAVLVYNIDDGEYNYRPYVKVGDTYYFSATAGAFTIGTIAE